MVVSRDAVRREMMAGRDSVVQIGEYSSAIRRWWPVVAVLTVAGLALGFLGISFQTRDYVAVSQVQVRPLVIAGDDPVADANRRVNAETEQAIANSQRVVESALALLGAAEEASPGDPLAVDLDDPVIEARALELLPQVDPALARRITKQISISVPRDSQILDFEVVGARPERAQQLAQATAHAYLDFRRDASLSATRIGRAQLIAREAELIAELDELAVEIGAAGEDLIRIQALTYREISKREELAGIGEKLANIDSISVDPGEVLNDAGLPDATTGLPPLAGPVFGVLLGAFAGLAAAYFLDRRDDRVRSTGQDISAMGLSVLGTVPVAGGMFRRGSGSAIAELNSPAGEAYRRVQGSLLFNLDQLDKSVLLVAGTNNPHSATTVAANLAVAAARSGRRTLLIGADLRRPSLHERFELSNPVGLTDVLTGAVTIGNAIQTIASVANLQILTAGSPVKEPSRLLQGEALGRLVSTARTKFDLIIFEAPPVLQVADAVDLARLSEGAVLVIEPNRATRGGVAESIEQLRLVGTDVVGTIVAEPTES